ncbi:hypothetical protein ACFQVA_09380 [Actinomadura keratinilytica]
MLIAYGLFSGGDAQSTGNWALGILLVMNILTVGTAGCTPGKLLLRLRVVSEKGGSSASAGSWPAARCSAWAYRP